jgi:hypothetical protein
MLQAEFDIETAHQFFAAHCFNAAWNLMEKPNRTAEEDEQMLRLSLASHWHWTQRNDYMVKTQSIAHWQTARIYALMGQADNARRYAQLCLQASQNQNVAPIYLAYAYEALARAEAVAENPRDMTRYLDEARQIANTIAESDSKQQLLDDLATIK